jgi:8-amino-7-oxononanoate synthase
MKGAKIKGTTSGRSAGLPWQLELEDLQNRGLYREMPSVTGLPGRLITMGGRQLLNFSGNNYLGLASHPAVIEAGADYSRRYGAGSTASRLIAGNTEAHQELENFIAGWKGTEAALVFGSGYQANLGILTSLTDEQDLIISDELNHASIIDGCKLSRSTVEVYLHLDLNHLEELLRLNGFRRKLVVTESVFSMEGDKAPLKEIGLLCKQWGALLMVDEAHATGVLGPQGQGLAAELGVLPDIQMGTLGKAVGVAGAYVAGTRGLIELLINKARPLVYTTAAPPGAIGSALAALKIIASDEGEALRAALTTNANTFHVLLQSFLGHSRPPSHIVPFRIGESDKTMLVSRKCMARGVFAHGIRYPTVPEGSARLRFALMSHHTSEDLRQAVSALADALNE